LTLKKIQVIRGRKAVFNRLEGRLTGPARSLAGSMLPIVSELKNLDGIFHCGCTADGLKLLEK
jgi:hypothetical protein